MTTLEITPLDRPVDADVTVPGSKSYTNRALLIAALGEGTTTLAGALFSDDTTYMANALRSLGIEVEEDPEKATFVVHGKGGRIPVNGEQLTTALDHVLNDTPLAEQQHPSMGCNIKWRSPSS